MPESILELMETGVYLITSSFGGQDSGMIVTWLSPASLTRTHPRIVTALSPKNRTTELIQKSRRFVVHLLSRAQFEYVALFGLYSSRDVNKFRDLHVTRSPGGMPILEGTCGWLECTIIAEVELGDRFLYVAEITAKGAVSTSDTPLQLNDAFSRLPKDVVQALDQKHNKDMLRDEDLVKRFPQS